MQDWDAMGARAGMQWEPGLKCRTGIQGGPAVLLVSLG